MEGDEPDETELVYLALPDVLNLYALIIGASASEAADQLRNRDGLQVRLRDQRLTPTTSRRTWRSKPPSWLTASPRVNHSSTATSVRPLWRC